MAFHRRFSWLLLALVAVLPVSAQTVVRAGIQGPAWTAGMSCPTGQYVTASPDDLHVFRAVNSVTGTAGATQPTWNLLAQSITNDGTCQWAEWGTSGSTGNAGGGGSGSTPQTLPNCTATGGMVAMLGFQFATQTVGGISQLCGTLATASSTVVEGICQTACGASGTATVVYNGVTAGILDGAGQANDYVIPSSTPGYFTDVGLSRPSGTTETVGIIALPNTGGNGTAAQIFVSPLSLFAPGSSSGGGTTNNAAQGQIPWYCAPGSSNILCGGAGTTDGSANNTFHSLTINGGGTGVITMGNASASLPSKPAAGNSSTFTDTNGNFLCINSSGNSCTGTAIDVRVGYGNSGGVDCSGGTDSTTILQNMINNAPDFSKFVFPENCKVLVSTTSGNPKAITLQSRTGLEFWFEGRNANGCDGSGPSITDNSAYASGATIWYINQSQRLLFHNVVMNLNGATDIGFDVDQTTSPPITTANIWENNCIRNNVARNAAFRGWRFSNTSANNIEAQYILRSYVQCSNQAATSYTSNGAGIFFGNNSNQKTEVVDGLTTNNCSADEAMGTGSDFTANHFLMSNSYSNITDGAYNSLVMGMRSENATHAIDVTNPTGPHTYLHNDFASANGSPIDCTQGSPSVGCGFVVGLGNEADSDIDILNPASNGQVTAGFLIGNRHLTVNQFEWQGGVFTTQALNGVLGFTPILNTFGENLSPAVSPLVNSNNLESAPLILESAYGSTPTFDTYLAQNVPDGAFGNISNATITLGAVNKTLGLGGSANWPGTGITHWLAFLGNQTGITLAQSPQPGAPILNVVGGTGSTCYTYLVVAHGNTGTTQAGTSAQTCLGPTVLSGSNYVRLSIPAVPGATFYDVYRTQCAGNGICLSNPTGIIGQMAAVIYVNGLQSAASAINLEDTALSAGGQSAPSTNSTGGITTANCSAAGTAANPSVASCGGAIAGAVSCATNASTGTCTVNTTLVTTNSDILINQRTDTVTGTRLSVTCNTSKDTNSTAPQVTAISAGVSFTFQLGTFSSNPECFNYLIIN